ncbi:MAG: pyridoxamine 5'-phosphate oxidase family protein [Pseudomonadota bacterium]
MSNLPENFLKAWDEREPRMIFSTVDNQGETNAVWVLCVNLIDHKKIQIANNSFSKTLDNILAGSRGSLLMIAPEREAYQIKGSLEYYTEGTVYQEMKDWLDPKFAGVGTVVLNIESIYYGAEKVF